jgi:hypothetical protein
MRGSNYFKKLFEFNQETEDEIQEQISVEFMHAIVQFTDPDIHMHGVDFKISIEMFQCLDYYDVPNFVNYIRRQIYHGDTDLIMSNLEYFSQIDGSLIIDVRQYLRQVCNGSIHRFDNDARIKDLDEMVIPISNHLLIAWNSKCAVLVKGCMELLLQKRLTETEIPSSRHDPSGIATIRVTKRTLPDEYLNLPMCIKNAVQEYITRTPTENEDPMYFINMILSNVDTDTNMDSK